MNSRFHPCYRAESLGPRRLIAWVIFVLAFSNAPAQYATFAQRQQAVINGCLNNYNSALAHPNFAEAEAFFSNSQPTQGNAIVAAEIAILQANPSNWAGDLQVMISGMDCYYRYGTQWTQANQTNFESFCTTFQGYSGETTSNLTLLAASERYLGGQAWGESAYQTTGTYTVYRTSDPTGVDEVTSRAIAQAQTGVGEFASRPYGLYDTYPLLVVGQWSNNATLKSQALISYELAIAQAAGSWLNGAWAAPSGRSYPDEMVQSPWGGAEQMWLYLGGVPPPISYNNESLAPAIAGYSIAESGTLTGTLTVPGYQPPAAIVQAANATGTFTTQTSFNGTQSEFQSIYKTPNYAVFSNAVSPGTGIFDQIYPFGVMWNDSNTSHYDLLWLTDPTEDTPSGVSGLHTHGMNGRSVQFMQQNGTFVMLRTVSTGTTDFFPYLLGYAPGGYQAEINDAANGRIYLYYNNAVMIAISSTAPFTWDPQGGIACPSTTVFSGDSQFQLPAITSNGYDIAGCALETANPSDYPGATPAQQLAAFQTAVSKNPLPTLAGSSSPTITYTDHLGQSLQKTYYGTSGVNGIATTETNTINGVPFDYASWPQIYTPGIVQAYGGNVVVSSGNQQTTYDLTHWVVSTATVTAPSTPTGLTITPGQNSAQLVWNSSPTATGYMMQRGTSSSGPFTTIQSNVIPTQVNDYGLNIGTTYYYRLAAFNNVGTSAYTAPVAFTSVQTGLLATYYNNLNFTAPAYSVELDPLIDYYWTTPFDNGLQSATFSVKWTGYITAPSTGTFTFYLESQNGAELSINGSTVVNFLGNHPTNSTSGPGNFSMVAGLSYPITVTYSDGCECELYWTTPTNSTKSIVPNSAFTPPVTSAPTNLAAQAANSAVGLSWTASPIATNYNVKRSTTSGSGYVTISSPTGTSYIDPTSVNGTTYYYVVSAVDGGGESANSSQVNATPQAAIASAPIGLSISPGNTQVSLGWTQVIGALSYNIYRSITGGSGYSLIGNSTTTSFTDSTASNGTAYSYVVTSVNPSGESGYSSALNATPEPPAPQQATNLAATVAINQVNLSWTAATNATSYDIYRSTTSDSNFALIGTTTSTTYVDSTAVGGTTYYYAVASVNASGQSNDSLQIGVTPEPPIPSPPAQLSATGATSEVLLDWGTSTGATSYNVYRSVTTGTGYSEVGSATTGSYTDSTGTIGTTYYYVVTAVNSTGESGYSSQASAIPIPPLASAPTSPIAAAGSGHVGLSWTAASGATSYTILRSTSSTGPFALIGTSSIPNYTDATAVNGMTYYYEIYSVNLAGQSTSAASISATPQASTSVLPSPWVDQDINAGATGSATFASGTFTVNGAGTQIWSTNDGFNFVYRPLVGDGVLVARVLSGGATHKTGLIMRQSLTANSTYVDDVFNGGPDAVKTEYRASAGSSATSAPSTPPNDVTETSFPYWLELVRTGNQITAYRSPDGVNWTQNGGTVTDPLTDPINVGLAQCSDTNTTVASAAFANVTMLTSPMNLTAASVQSTLVQLGWQINPGGVVSDTAAQQVEVSPTGANTWTVLTSTLTPSTGTLTVTNLSPATGYDFRVNSMGNGVSSPYATLTNVLTAPATPTLEGVAQSGSAVDLVWGTVTGAASYSVGRATIRGGPYSWIGSSATGSYTDATVSAGTAYSYVVSAVGAGGESSPSNQVSITVLSAFQQWLAANGLATSTAESAMPDNDGVSLLMKYATGLIPGTPSAAGPAAIASTGTTGGNFLKLEFSRLNPAPVNYLVESSPDLVNWTSLVTLAAGASSWTGSATVTESGTNPVQVTVTDSVVLPTGTTTGTVTPRFLRLRTTTSTDTLEPSTVPMGDVPVTLAAGATGATSLPLDNTPVGRNSVQVVAASALTVVNAGSWTSSTAPYALRLLSGKGSGCTFAITGQTGNALTLATQGVDLTQLVAAGDLYEILPLDTLGTLYGASSPLVQSGNSAAAADNVLLWNGTTWLTYFFSNSSNSWKQSGSLLNQNNTPLPPGAGLLFTRRGATALNYPLIGRVPEVAQSQFTMPGGTTFVGAAYPIASTLGTTGFATASGWRSGNSAASADDVLDWNGTTWLTFFFNGTNWKQSGSLLNQNSYSLAPAQPLMIQRQSSPATLNAFVPQPLIYSP
jgi:fibronectin type 3 domain-containing protein